MDDLVPITRYNREEVWSSSDVELFIRQSTATRAQHALHPDRMFENSPHPMMKVDCMGEII